MARPKKDTNEKRDKRLTIYLTQLEEDTLNTIQSILSIDKTKFIIKSMHNEINHLENPPEQIKKAKYQAIINSKEDSVSGYICLNGHVFWLDLSWPSPPLRCPCCGSKDIEQTWSGKVFRGFSK